ncbi:MAG TPA: type II secretion system F family protein [Methanolinea sp.]|nr:type II secretion system F family protein [Methanolinea sp.]
MSLNSFLRNRVRQNPLKYQKLESDLESARFGVTVERYLARAIQIGVATGIAFALLGFWLTGIIVYTAGGGSYTGVYNVFSIPFPEKIEPQSAYALPLQVTGAIVAFIMGFMIVYLIALHYPSMQKKNRATKINLTLHNAVAYMYAMRKGGAQMMTIFRSLSENAKIYGEVALEFRQVVRDADFFGYDLVTALRHLIRTTPSEKMKQFLEDLVSVIESGGDLVGFLSGRVRLYQEEARFEQKQFLQFLSLVAESYVTLFVAGPLFLIIIMVVMGMMGGMAILQLTAVVYLVFPIGSAVFILLIDLISLKSEVVERFVRAKLLHEYSDVPVYHREGEEPFFSRLARYDRVRRIREFFRHPFEFFVKNYNYTLLFSVPLAVLYLVALFLVVPQYADIEIYIDVIDDHVMIALLIVLVPYSFFYEMWRRNIEGMEALIPEFLERMAGINQVGLTIAQAISIMVNTNLGLLSYEIRRIKRDIDWGASFADALVRFEDRVRTPLIARTVSLITKASQMSGSIGDVLAIAASDAKMSDLLKRERLSDMFIYTAIIYMAFVVFVFVVGVISNSFIPILGNVGGGTIPQGTPLASISSSSIKAILRLMYHSVVLQALMSGLIAGQMGEGSLKAGVKHSCIMLVIALVIFNLVL